MWPGEGTMTGTQDDEVWVHHSAAVIHNKIGPTYRKELLGFLLVTGQTGQVP